MAAPLRTLVALVLLLTLPLFAGCIEGCEPPERIAWGDHPGLWDLLPDPAPHIQEGQNLTLGAFYPTDGSTTVAAWGHENVSIFSVSWNAGGGLGDATDLTLHPTGSIAVFGVRQPNETTRHIFTAFTTNVTSAAPAQVERWADAFMANQTDTGEAIPGPGRTYRLDATVDKTDPATHLDRLVDAGYQMHDLEPETFGRSVEVRNGTDVWTYTFRFREKALPLPDDAPFKGSVDPRDHVVLRWSGVDPDERTARDQMTTWFEEAGLEAPRFDRWHFAIDPRC